MNIRDFQVEAEARSMSKDQKWRYLYSREWVHAGNNRWKHRPTGQVMPFGTAVRAQLERDIAAAG